MKPLAKSWISLHLLATLSRWRHGFEPRWGCHKVFPDQVWRNDSRRVPVFASTERRALCVRQGWMDESLGVEADGRVQVLLNSTRPVGSARPDEERLAVIRTERGC